MAKKGNRILSWMICSECGRQNYVTDRNKLTTAKLLLSKHCKDCKKHTDHKSKDKLK